MRGRLGLIFFHAKIDRNSENDTDEPEFLRKESGKHKLPKIFKFCSFCRFYTRCRIVSIRTDISWLGMSNKGAFAEGSCNLEPGFLRKERG